MNAIIPIPKFAISVREATPADVPFMDSLQRIHTKQVGWMPTKQFAGKIKLKQVIIAEDKARRPVGYCIGHDQYFKHDDIGIIYQLNVAPSHQRGQIGATLLKAMFDRAAYGCRLFCCWCAQDIEANRFWESMGFVPLAFRAGSREKSRVHIFWQKRIREGDTATPWWFPSQTSGGSIREDRLVFPIPPGTHWSDAKPIILPGADMTPKLELELPKPRQNRPRHVVAGGPRRLGGWTSTPSAPLKQPKAKREKQPKQKNDPKFVAAARELRDRYLEHVNNDPTALPGTSGKYDVCKQIEATPTKQTPLLAA